MPRITWNETYSVNNPEIDEQHKKWIAIINSLHDILLQGSVADLKHATVDILHEMQQYGEFHFAFEEKYLQENGYPDLEAHRHEHDFFRSRVNQYLHDQQHGKLVLNTDIMDILMSWLQSHILSEDMEYCRFLSQRQR